MVLPPLPPRVEQFGHGTGIRVNAGEIWTFMEVAIDARQTKVVLVIGAAVLARADMLDVERGQRRIFLTQTTVFTSTGGPSTH